MNSYYYKLEVAGENREHTTILITRCDGFKWHVRVFQNERNIYELLTNESLLKLKKVFQKKYNMLDCKWERRFNRSEKIRITKDAYC